MRKDLVEHDILRGLWIFSFKCVAYRAVKSKQTRLLSVKKVDICGGNRT